MVVREYKWVPVIDEDRCTGCRNCVEACGPNCLELVDGVAVLVGRRPAEAKNIVLSRARRRSSGWSGFFTGETVRWVGGEWVQIRNEG
jgi:formate hydrogenlyase subunit 6/NADH:ubiquinone oxidoreductase subunit I